MTTIPDRMIRAAREQLKNRIRKGQIVDCCGNVDTASHPVLRDEHEACRVAFDTDKDRQICEVCHHDITNLLHIQDWYCYWLPADEDVAD